MRRPVLTKAATTLLRVVFIIQLGCPPGYAQFYEPYKSPQPVTTSFVNQPISSINPYSKFDSGVGERVFQTVDQNAFGQSFSSPSSQVTFTVQDGRILGSQQQQFTGGLQSSFVRQQPSNIEYLPVQQETRISTQVPQQAQQVPQPNFIYSRSNQGPVASDLETSDLLPVQREVVYPVGNQYVQQTQRTIPQVQFTPNTLSSQYQSSHVAPSSVPQTENTNILPFSSIRSSLPDDSQVVTIGGQPFIFTSLKTKPSVTLVPTKQNPLESFKAEALIESILNRGKTEGRTNQIVINTKDDSSRLLVADATETLLPTVVSTTPLPAVTDIGTETPSSQSPSPLPQKMTLTSTTSIPTVPPITTTTTQAPPPVHAEVTTTEERYYISRKKKVTVSIRVEDAGFDAEEKEIYSTKQDFHEWTKTIIEPTGIFDETKVYLESETREVEGPALAVEVTKLVCRNFVDNKEVGIVERDLLKESATCPKPVSSDTVNSWESRAFHRIEKDISKKLKDIFNIPELTFRMVTSNVDEGSKTIHKSSSSPSNVHSAATVLDNGFLPKTLNAINDLRLDESVYVSSSTKRDTDKPRHLVEDHDLVPAASEAQATTAVSSHHVDEFEESPNQTAKRETKTEVVDVEDKLDAGKSVRAITETVVHTTPSHIMLITRSPPVRPPNPYPHPPRSTYGDALPKQHALHSSVPLSMEENEQRTFFRRST